MKLADRAMYAAKHASRDAWVGVSRGSSGEADSLTQVVRDDPEGAIDKDWIRLDTHLDAEPVIEQWHNQSRRAS